ELYALQFELDALIHLRLPNAAQQLCVRFERTRGHNSLTRYYRLRLLAGEDGENVPREADLSPAYILLDLATQHPHMELARSVDGARAQAAIGAALSVEEINESDDHPRWHLRHLDPGDYDLLDPASAARPIPAHLYRVWRMAAVNFLLARRLELPVLV